MDRRRSALVASAAVTLTLVAAAVPAAAAKPPSGTVAISPLGGAADQQQLLTPVAGNADIVIYLETPTLGDGTAENDTAAIYSYQPETTPVLVGEETGATRFSLAGSMLTALEQPQSAHPIVAWWNLANDTSGAAATPGTYAGAAPDGWVYTSGNSIHDESSTGTSALIAKVASIGTTITTATTGPAGIVVYGNASSAPPPSRSAAAYVTFAGAVTALNIGPYSAAHHDIATCAGTSATATACEFVKSTGSTDKVLASERMSLDGGPPLPIPAKCFNGHGNDIFIALEPADTDCVNVNGNGVTQAPTAPGGLSRHRGPVLLRTIVAALGSVVAAMGPVHSSNALWLIPVGSESRSILFGDRATLTAGAFALTTGRISYVDDPYAGNETVSTPLTSDRTQITLGTPTVVSNRGFWSETAASGSTTIWGNSDAPIAWADLDSASTTHIGQFIPGTLSISGSRVLFAKRIESDRTVRLKLYDLRTRTISPPAGVPIAVLSKGYVRSGLAGSFMAYAHDGAVWRVDVSTGQRIKVADAAHVSSVFVYGPYVGWNVRHGSGSFRYVDAHGPVVRLASGQHISSLSNNGVVFFRTSDTHTVAGKTLPSSYQLRSYSGDAVRSILDAPLSTAVAQVNDSVVAWRDDHYDAEAAPVDAPTTVPYWLGDPTTSAAKYFPPDDGDWDAQFDFSTALTGCGLTISHAGKAVRVVACSAENLPLGVAAISWDGTDAHGKQVPAGRYTWTITVGNHTGLAKQHSGTIAVPRAG